MTCGLNCTSLRRSNSRFEVITDVTLCGLLEIRRLTSELDF